MRVHFRSPIVRTAVAASLTALMTSVPVLAQTPAVRFTGSSLGGYGVSATVGFTFRVNTSLSVTALGIYDHDLDGLLQNHEVGIFDSTGVLITSGTIPSGTVAPLTNQFRYVPIAPTILQPGIFTIGACYPVGDDSLASIAENFSTDTTIIFGGSRVTFSNSLVPPTSPAGKDPGFFGPNFLARPVSTASEPSSLTFLLPVIGAARMIVRRRRIQSQIFR